GVDAPGLMQTFAVHWRRLVEVVVDFFLITGAFTLAYLLKCGCPGTPTQRHMALVSLPIVIAARYLAFIPFGLYRSIWRYAGARDVAAIASAVAVSEVVALAYIVLTQNLGDFARSFFVVDALVCAVVIGGSRLVERALVTGLRTYNARTGRKTLIVGAGRTGRSLMRELRETAGGRGVG